MKAISGVSLLAGALLASVSWGCSGEQGDATETVAEQAREVRVEEIASIPVMDGRINFLMLEGSSEIILEQQAPLNATKTPFQRLGGQALTSLEIFRAIAPDQAPPEAIVAAHAAEARTLGRPDDQLMVASIDTSSLEEKGVTGTACNVMLKNPYNSNYEPWGDRQEPNNLTGTHSLCVGQNCEDGQAFPAVVRIMGICNNNASNTLPYRVYSRPDGAPTWTFFSRTAAPDSINAWYAIQTYIHNDKIEGRPTVGSQLYHLRVAYAYHK
jgi:hypothetical protein